MELKQYSNKFLQEVICGFNFIESGIIWSSIYFGKYANQIEGLGFDNQEEQRGFQINFGEGVVDQDSLPRVSAQEIESKMLFRDENLGRAIMLAKDQISFHIVRNYEGWESFSAGLIEKGMEAYKKVGLLQGKVRANMAYITRFELNPDEPLSDYFTFLNSVGTAFGKEKNTHIHRIFDEEDQDAFLVVRLDSTLNESGTKSVILQTGAITKPGIKRDDLDWEQLADMAHTPIRDFFESLITEKLRNIL